LQYCTIYFTILQNKDDWRRIMIFKREMRKVLRDMAQHYPVVTVTGPRQAGKTTLVKTVFSKAEYINLEAPDVRQAAQLDPRRFLKKLGPVVILDEVQNVPELLSYIQVMVDEVKKPGQFILTGSHQFSLNEAITQSLAGRTALLNLLPLTLRELSNSIELPTLDNLLLRGFYPKYYNSQLNIVHLQRQYLQTYVERDLRQLIHLKDLSAFQKFLTLCASNIGQLINYQKMANAVGVSVNTAKHWLTILEASYVIFRLQPFFSNIKKRLIRSPKMYFVDVGLAAYLLGIETTKHMAHHPLRGELFENMIVMDLVKERYNMGLHPRLSFYRDSQGLEVDILFELGGNIIPIEIKSSETFHPRFLKAIKELKKVLPNIEPGYIVYAGDYEQGFDGNLLLNYKKTYRCVEQPN
jgi:uncharacterized protein